MSDFGVFDFRDLANSLVNNGQNSLPPSSVQRLGQIAGIDPAFPSQDVAGAPYPSVSVFIAGDNLPTHGCRYVNSYVPHLGDTVICMVTGPEVYVMGVMGGAPRVVISNGVPVITTAAAPTTAEAHGQYIIGQNQPGGSLDITGPAGSFASGNYTEIAGSLTASHFLPNTLYKIEFTADFTISAGSCGSGTCSLSFAAKTPSGWLQLCAQPVAGPTPAGATVTAQGTKTYSDKMTIVQQGAWGKKYPNNQWDWAIGALTDNTSGTPPTIHFGGAITNMTMTISNMGPAS